MRVWWRIGFSALWLLFVCYPDPRVLWRAIQRTVRPPIDPAAVRRWAVTLPDDPAQIEQAVLSRLQYAVPWQSAGVPWTIASPAEALAAGLGDCQARAVTLASVLAAKGIPYRLRASVDHMWVEYPGKQPNALENKSKTLWERHEQPAGGGGRFRFRLPAIDLAESYAIEKDYFWDAAPASKKALLLTGLAIIWALGRTPARSSCRSQRPAVIPRPARNLLRAPALRCS